jgi:hypothetical protein
MIKMTMVGDCRRARELDLNQGRIRIGDPVERTVEIVTDVLRC